MFHHFTTCPRGNILKSTISAILLICLLFMSMITIAPNVGANQITSNEPSEQDFEQLGLHYGKYLKDVVAALDKDHQFSETIKNMDANDIKSGKVAEQLKHVHEDIRKKLSELKYLEIKRLRDLATIKNEINEHGETLHGHDKRKWRTVGIKDLPEHLASDKAHFDVEDLHKLIVKATNDLEKLDKERTQDYKVYEMEKEWQFQERMKMMNETEKQEAIKQRQQMKEKHDDHPKVHEPGSRQQFEEVWEKKDNLPKSEFNPNTFFQLHDLNSDNFWDQHEVRQLLYTEISKLYDAKNPEDDPNEMEEEFERMREHMYKEIDLDRDGLISRLEFLDYSKKPEFQKDAGWQDVSQREAYSRQDYDDFTKNRDKMLHQMHGHYDPTYYSNQPANMHLPNWGFGMPAGVDPAQYYGYHVDPNHPQVQQMMAHQQQMAYQQQANYHQQPGYQQPGYPQQPPMHQPQQSQQQSPPQLSGPPQANYQQQQAPVANQQYYQQAPQQQQYQQKPPAPQQQQPSTYQAQPVQQPPAQATYQQQPPVQQAQPNYQQQTPQQQPQQQPPVQQNQNGYQQQQGQQQPPQVQQVPQQQAAPQHP